MSPTEQTVGMRLMEQEPHGVFFYQSGGICSRTPEDDHWENQTQRAKRPGVGPSVAG